MDKYFKILQTVLSNGRGMDVVNIKKPTKVYVMWQPGPRVS